MAKKQIRSSPNHSTVKKTSEVASPAKKPLEVATTSNKPLVVSPPAKKPTAVASTSKKPVEEVASTSKKKKQPVINPPPESLTDDKEMETEEEGEDDASSEEEDKLNKPVKTPSASAPVVAATVVQSSGSESGSETDSETEPPPPPPADVVFSRALRKRPSEVTASTDVNARKRAKTETEETENTAKKVLIQRVWSKKDEVALLQGMLRLKNKTGNIHSDNFAVSYEMVKGSSYLKDKTCSQFSNKVKSLKDKYLKTKKNRTKAHDMKCLDLCKKIWGNDLVVEKSKKKMKVEDDESDGESDWFERANLVGDLMVFGVVDEVAVKRKWSFVSAEVKKKLEEKWQVLEAHNFERLMKRSEFVYEVISAINNAN